MPNRQVSTSSTLSDDAVPTSDPTDVSVLNVRLNFGTLRLTTIMTDRRALGRASASLETRSWVPRGLYWCNGKGTEGACEGV
jgi:hypothetical protein